MKIVTPDFAHGRRRLDKRALSVLLARRLAWHQAVHDPERDPRNDEWLPELRRWRAARLAASFQGFMQIRSESPQRRFFLTDLYGDRDFSRRDSDIARVAGKMQRLAAADVLETLADAIELGALSHAFDLRMAEALERLAPRRKTLDDDLYGRARSWAAATACASDRSDRGRRLRPRPCVAHSRRVDPAERAARAGARGGFGELQSFLERGFGAYAKLDDVSGFIADIERSEHEAARRRISPVIPSRSAPLPDAHPPSGAARKPIPRSLISGGRTPPATMTTGLIRVAEVLVPYQPGVRPAHDGFRSRSGL